MENDEKRYRSGLITGIIVGIAFMLIIFLGRGLLFSRATTAVNQDGIKEDMDTVYGKINTVKRYLDKYYYEDVDEDKLTDGIYYGMSVALGDPYTTYYTKDEYKKLLESNEGQYCGIGVSVTQNQKTGEFLITNVFSTAPAKDAGILKGDIITKIDGKDVSGDSLDQLVSRVAGKEGTNVKVTVNRDNQSIDFDITRKKIDIDTVTYEMKDNNVGYIKITEFDGITKTQVREAITSLQSQGMEKLIIDLRDNPGGRLDSVLDIASAFIEGKGLFLYSKTKDGTRDDYYLEDSCICPDTPMVVLVNENSASASEAFTGNMKAYKRATIVGTTTFGKGIMQSLYPMSDGSALKITVGKYYLPDDSNIHKTGITPDVEVEKSDDPAVDEQLNKAMEVVAGLK